MIVVKGCKSLFAGDERKGAYLHNAIVRLAAYEDTGMTPEEIMAAADVICDLKSRLSDALNERDTYRSCLDSANQTNAALAKKLADMACLLPQAERSSKK